jgi:alpha-glucosidase
VFTFGKGFPKPKSLMRSLAKRGFHTVAIVDPGVKNDPGFGVLRRGMALDAFVKQADGVSDQLGEVWPGESRFPDFLNPDVRTWWGTEQQTLLEAGIEGIWNDMNEPANFARPDKTLPLDALHRTPEGLERHERVHNAYGMAMAQASYDGFLKAPGPRPCSPFVVTRAGYAGVQRYGVVWTGDTSSNWDHLNDAVQMLCNLSLSGVPFCGADVGGFLENASAELFVRWFQFAAFTPFFRSHSNCGTARQEPWAYGPKIEAICRHFLELRSRWMPWWYCLMAEAHRTGRPVLRPLWWLDPNDETAVRCGDQFLVGDSLLVAPILRQGARARSVYLPAGNWYDFWSGRYFSGKRHHLAEGPLERIPLYIRAGAILPGGPMRQFTEEAAPVRVDLNLWLGGEGRITWWEADARGGNPVGTLHHGRLCSLTQKENEHLLALAASEGALNSNVQFWRTRIHGATRKPCVVCGGLDVPVRLVKSSGTYCFTVPNSPCGLEIEIRTRARPGSPD